MPILAQELSAWDVSFRWAGYDPDIFYFRYPLLVKDNFRLLMSAILEGEIICPNMCLDKRPEGSNADPAYYIRTYLDDVYACIHGRKYSKKLLKWAEINRNYFHEWCTRRGITPPEFWFPNGWKLDYDCPEGGPPGYYMRHQEPENGGLAAFTFNWPDFDEEEPLPSLDDEDLNSLRPSQKTKLVCQTIAETLWRQHQNRTIADMVRCDEIQRLSGGQRYAYEVVRRWLSEVAPIDVKKKRGRPPKENTTK